MSGIGRNRVWLPPVLPSCRAGCMRSLALVPFLSLFRVFGLPLFLPAFLFAPSSLLLFFCISVLGFFLFGQLPDGWSVLGYLLICGISVAVFFYNRNLERKGQ